MCNVDHVLFVYKFNKESLTSDGYYFSVKMTFGTTHGVTWRSPRE